MAKKKSRNIHVIPRNDGWAVRGEGNSRLTSVHDTQRDAIDAARKIARDEKGELVIHARDGRIRERDSYGSDPLPPKSPREVLFPTTLSKAREKAIKKAIREVIRESQGRPAGESKKSLRG